jgi:outer membrane lipoprotein SlyB
VVIEGLRSDQAAGWGTAVGATVAGAAAYGLTRADTPLGVAVTIIAAIGGALVGTIAEEQKNKWPGAEYILDQSDGTQKAIVQVLARDEKIIPPGQQVAIIHGRKGFYRVVPVK